jgi:hypothetical protein
MGYWARGYRQQRIKRDYHRNEVICRAKQFVFLIILRKNTKFAFYINFLYKESFYRMHVSKRGQEAKVKHPSKFRGFG